MSELESSGASAVLIDDPGQIRRLTDVVLDTRFPALLALSRQGSVLSCAARPVRAIVDQVVTYAASVVHGAALAVTAARAVDGVRPALKGARVIAAELWRLPQAVVASLAGVTFIEAGPVLARLRRAKGGDEIEAMRRAIGAVEAGYEALRSVLRPGAVERDVFHAAWSAIAAHAGGPFEMRSVFQAGVRGLKGALVPTDRRLQAGELVCFDVFPQIGGYSCDLCRTYCVGELSEIQQRAFAHLEEAHRKLQAHLMPGTPTAQVYASTLAHLETFTLGSGFDHHLGHGVGLEGWEAPSLTADTADVLVEGDVVAIEPALYRRELGGPLRLEHDYLITASGPVRLDSE